MSIKTEIQSLSPSALIELFALDYTNLPGGSVLRFHSGTNGLQQPIVWQGNTYYPYPIQAEGFDRTAKGPMPRPKLRAANVGGTLSELARANDDFVGCKVIRKRTFAKYLDAVNFPTQTITTAGTNKLSTSSLTTAGGWTGSGILVFFPGNYWGPPGDTLRATFLGGSYANEEHYVELNTEFTGVSTTLSFWALETAWHRHLRIRFIREDGTESYATFDLATETIPNKTADATATIVNTTDTPIDRNYKRVSLTVPNISGVGKIRIQFADPADPTRIVFPNIAAIYGFWISGLQLQQGPLSTFEEPTTVTVTTGGNPDANPNQYLPDDFWYVERKMGENRFAIEFELSSAFDLMGQQLPNRQVLQNACPWKYRSTECGWTGSSYDINNQPTTVASADKCAKTLTACRTRFANVSQPIRFGGFPGATRGSA